jgi:hypothetical protein
MSKTPGILKKMRIYITVSNNISKGVIDEKSIKWITLDENRFRPKDKVNNILDITHPSIVSMSKKWNGHNIWLAATPYPESIGYQACKYENSSIFYADYDQNGKFSRIKSIRSNPIIHPQEAEYNSDPDLLFDNNKLYCLSRKYNAPDYLTNIVIQSSTDGEHWSPEGSLIKSDEQNVSPAIIKIKDIYRIYTFNSTYTNSSIFFFKYGYKNDTKDVCIWESASLENPKFILKKRIYWTSNSNFWHGDIVYYKNKFYMVYCGYNKNYKYCFNRLEDNNKYLWFAISNDGYHFKSFSKPILKKAGIYRPSITISNNNLVTIIFATDRSYFDNLNNYPAGNRIGYIQIGLNSLLRRID